MRRPSRRFRSGSHSPASLPLFWWRFTVGEATVRFRRSCANRARVARSCPQSPESCASLAATMVFDVRFAGRVEAGTCVWAVDGPEPTDESAPRPIGDRDSRPSCRRASTGAPAPPRGRARSPPPRRRGARGCSGRRASERTPRVRVPSPSSYRAGSGHACGSGRSHLGDGYSTTESSSAADFPSRPG